MDWIKLNLIFLSRGGVGGGGVPRGKNNPKAGPKGERLEFFRPELCTYMI